MTRPTDPDAIRLNRFLARAGLGSRRAVESLVRTGRVCVDGATVADLGRRVDPHRSRVEVDGRRIVWPEAWRVFAFHKPVGVITSLRPQGRTPCLDLYAASADLPAGAVPVGRLDVETSGLLIWTDDGELHQALCRPGSVVWKIYEATLERPLPPAAESRLENGEIALDGRPCLQARLRCLAADRLRWEFALREGRNRQVRRMFSAVGAPVAKLHRTAVGDLRLDDLAPGAFRELAATETKALRRAAGLEV